MRAYVCVTTHMVGGSGGMLPQENLPNRIKEKKKETKKEMKYPFPVPSPYPNPNCNTKS